jgi:amylovoran biosynthesis glycosyltransferase AmsE
MKKKDFTVLMPVYNSFHITSRFESAINSVYTNSFKPKSVIVIANGKLSKNFRIKLLEIQKKKKFRLYFLQKASLHEALNYGLKKINTPWVIRADGDDINNNNRFKILSNYFEKYDLIGSYVDEVDENNKLQRIKKVPILKKNILKYAKFRNPFNHMSVAFKSEIIKKVGCYPHIYLKEDYALWAKLIQSNVKMINLSRRLVKAYSGSGMIIRRSGYKILVSEIMLQKLLYDTKINSIFMSFVSFSARFLFLLAPFQIKKILYNIIRR